MLEQSGSVTEWLKPKQPLAVWWQRQYPGLHQVARDLAARVTAVRSADQGRNRQVHSAPSIPVDTPGLRYYDYGLLGGAVDYRMRIEFTRQWGGDPSRSAFTRAWAGRRGSLVSTAAYT